MEINKFGFTQNQVKKINEMCNALFTANVETIIFDEDLSATSLLCLSARYFMEKDIRCKKIMCRMIKNNTITFTTKIAIFFQLSAWQFRYNEIDDLNLREIYAFLANQVKKECETAKLRPITKEDLNRNTIVCITTQFLGLHHSPTKLLLKLIKSINDNFKEIDSIYIFNSVESLTEADELFINPTILSYIDHNAETIEYVLGKEQIDRCGIGYDTSGPEPITLNRLNDLAKEIYEIKPKYIFSIGGECLLAEICNNFSDVFTISLSNDVPISECKYLVVGNANHKVEEIKLNSQQVLLKRPFAFDVFKEMERIKYTRKEHGLSEEDFLISVVGNRLNEDVTDDFLDLCIKLVENHSKVGIVFIGRYNELYYESKVKDELKSHFYTIGLKEDIISAIQLTNVYLNPKRLGGGYSSIAAMEAGVPVISTPLGDVGMYINDAFKCKDYEEMYMKVAEMIEDKSSYKESCRKTIEWFNQFNEDSNKILIQYIEDSLRD